LKSWDHIIRKQALSRILRLEFYLLVFLEQTVRYLKYIDTFCVHDNVSNVYKTDKINKKLKKLKKRIENRKQISRDP